MIQSVLTEERAITQDTEIRHLVHTWWDTDVLEPVDKALGPLSYILVLHNVSVLHLFGTNDL